MSHPTGLEGFSWLERTQKGKLWGRKGEVFVFFFFLIFFCESSLSLRELKACFRGRPGLASHQHFNDRRDNHSGCSFYSRNYGVPHNTGLPASSCAPSRSSNRGSQSHPPPPPPSREETLVSEALLLLGTAFCASPSCQDKKDTLL